MSRSRLLLLPVLFTCAYWMACQSGGTRMSDEGWKARIENRLEAYNNRALNLNDLLIKRYQDIKKTITLHGHDRGTLDKMPLIAQAIKNLLR